MNSVLCVFFLANYNLSNVVKEGNSYQLTWIMFQQSLLLDLLGLTANDKSILSRTIALLFPFSKKKKIVVKGERMYAYCKI